MLRFLLLVLSLTCVFGFNAQELEKVMKANPEFAMARTVCLKELNMNESDLPMGKFLHEEEASNQVLCFARCIKRELGFLDKNYNIVMDKVGEHDIFSHATAEQKTEFANCLKSVGTISECSDMKKLKECLHKSFH